MPDSDVLGYVLNEFERLTKKPENYLSLQENASLQIRENTKTLYDFTRQDEFCIKESSALPHLITEEFDDEQIWQQIELQNNSVWSHFLKNVSFCVAGKNKLQFPIEMPTTEMDNVEIPNENGQMEFDEPVNEANTRPKKKKIKKKNLKTSIVNDKFFNLGDLEHFLDSEDRKEIKPSKGKSSRNSESSGDEESVDLFEVVDSEELLEDMDEGESGDERPKYNDFFDDPDGNETMSDGLERKDDNTGDLGFEDDENDYDDNSDPDIGDLVLDDNHDKKKVRFNLGDDSSSENVESDGDNSPSKQSNAEPSIFQLRQERLKKKISHLEYNLLSEKPWQMKGEIDASGRPQNSLLEEIVDFDLTSRPAPVITEETTHKLEDVIVQRIKDKAWDDVERKAKPTKDPLEFKKALVLNQEKSKQSLAQVYEQEYIKQRDSLDPDHEKSEEEPKEHKEIREMMSALLTKLDALSNYHYTPKPAIPEVKIISNIPAISMEEVAPVATSDAALLAPEEVKKRPKGAVVGISERTDTDKKRERRKKKIKQREREKQKDIREKERAKSQPSTSKFKKINVKEKKRLLESVTKARNVSMMKPEKGKSAKSLKI